MSKSPNPLWPALGVTGIMLGAAYGLTTRGYKAEEAALAQTQALTAQAQVAEIASEKDSLAAQIAQVQADAQARIAELEARPVAATLSEPAPDAEGGFGLGREAYAEEVAAWNVDVLPDGRGLPEGRGDVFTGEEVFADQCAACHGDFAEGADNWPVLAGGFDTLANKDPVKTVGSYWPHLSTAWDYIHRSMPFGAAGTLSADDTYAIVAYILYSNDLVDDEFELSHENFAEFEMYNGNGFIIDDRPDLEYADWRAEPCMENCKEEVSITMRSVFLVATPEEGGTESMMNHATLDGLPTFSAAGPSHIPAAAAKPAAPVEEAAAKPAVQEDSGAELIAAGEKVFRKCKACHQIGDGAKNRTGPQLNALFGRTMGGVEGFKYSSGFADAQSEGRVWDEAELAAFLAKPKEYMKGTNMAFAGLKKEQDLAAITAYLKSFGD